MFKNSERYLNNHLVMSKVNCILGDVESIILNGQIKISVYELEMFALSSQLKYH